MSQPAATPSLHDLLLARIDAGGPLRFDEFMTAALYEPGLGYYARGHRQVGRAGDFFTSVSVGPLFGHLLARRFLRHWQEIGRPSRWRIIECGAHDGSLAGDVLDALVALDPAAFAALEYAIPEPLDSLRECQTANLARFQGGCRIVADSALLATNPLPGIAFGNEVLDALPCHLIVRRGGHWLERCVGSDGKRLGWIEAEISDPGLLAAVRALGNGFPEGYRSEVRTCYHGFLAPLFAALIDPLMVWVDYGFERPEYYDPSRVEGTLRTFAAHRADDDPLADPGAADITAHVDFTAVIEAASVIGADRARLRSQGGWLTEVARDWLLAMEGRPQPEMLRQFQTLTHPAHLGSRFHVLELNHVQEGSSEGFPQAAAAACDG